jgi:hypothetical protein
MLTRISLTMITLLLLLAACGQASPVTPTPTLSSGIEGNITEGPTCPGPVPMGGTQCQDRPYQATLQVLNSRNQVITQLNTDVDGYFKISLPPGVYIIHPLSGDPFPHAVDQIVSVPADQYTRISIQYDTGLR